MNLRSRQVLLAGIGLVLPLGAGAQDAIVRASVADDAQVWVGQRVTVVVELLAPGYFASAVTFDIPDPEGVLLMPPQEHPLVGNETIDGTLYTVQRHELLAWPMRAGEQSIPAVTARFSFKRNPLDADNVPASVTTEALPFTVATLPGAEKLGTVISARNLEVRESWNPEPGSDDISAGTAFTRTITFSAPDVPGMVFPPFRAPAIDGLGIYAKQQLRDHEERGSLTGMRRDEITYVCERPGQYTIPAAKLTWFDLDSQELRTEELPEQTLNVVANPAMASAANSEATAPVSSPLPWRKLAAGTVLVLLALLAARSRRVRQAIASALAPFRPVRLEPLYPAPSNQRTGQ
jgi:hypothetical protein